METLTPTSTDQSRAPKSILFFKKNLRKGRRRLNWYCRARISTQLWWLLVTSHECVKSSCSRPSTSHLIGWTRRIQKEFTAIQDSAIQCMAKRRLRCTGGKGRTSLTNARINKGQHQNKVLINSNVEAMMPRNSGGRMCSIEAIPQNNALSAAEMDAVYVLWLSFMRRSASIA